MSFEIKKENGRIVYTEADHSLYIYMDPREWIKEFGIKYIRNWEPPYEYEDISVFNKQRILKNVYDKLVADGFGQERLKFDFTELSNTVSFKELFQNIKQSSGWAYSPYPDNDKNWYYIDLHTMLYVKDYNTLSNVDKDKFHKLLLQDEKTTEESKREQLDAKIVKVTDNYKISRLLKDYAMHKVEECNKAPNQNPFTFGLYALDMVLTEDNQDEIKEILKQYKSVAQETNLSFKEFVSHNRPLNRLIEDVVKGT